MECGRVRLGPMRGAGSCSSTGSAGLSAAAAAAMEASATGASRRYRMLPLLVRTQSSLRRRLRWRESDSREAGMLSSVYWVSAAWRWLLLLRHCSRRWVRDGGGGCTAAPAGMFALRMTVMMIWGRGGGACSSRELVGRGKVGISRLQARQRHQGQRAGPFRPPIINQPGGEPKQAGRRRPASKQAMICGGGKR